MQDTQKWRDLLGQITKDAQERQRIANELGVNPVTLLRWVSGESKPRPHNLRLLLDALPEYRKVLLELIPEEFGAAFTEGVEADNATLEIPSVFYSRVMNAHCNLPRVLHFSSLCDVILQQALNQLDPNRIGLEITIAQCMPPTEDQKVRSLRESMGRGTPPWSRELEQRTFFLGLESLAGYVVTNGRFLALHNRQEMGGLFPVQWAAWEESAIAYPIMRSDRVAGCLLISSTQPEYFLSPARQKLVQRYAELLTVAFEPNAFCELRKIELGSMPPYEKQFPYLASFRRRVAETVLQATRQQVQMSVLQAEMLVWRQIERELLEEQLQLIRVNV